MENSLNPAHIEAAKKSIASFFTGTANHTPLVNDSAFRIPYEPGSNAIFVKDSEYNARFKVNFRKARNCRLLVGSNVTGEVMVHFAGQNSLVYIGDNCSLKHVQIRSRQDNDLIAVGDDVTTTGKNTWISGNGAGNANPAIVIGDDCMFSYDIVIRNTDAHPVFDLETHKQINEPTGIVHIEPHVWIGEQVNILKSVTIGACSIIGMGSMVTTDVPRFATAAGVPARSKQNKGSYWSRNYSQSAREKAIHFAEKYRG